jgi:LemA protein
MHRRERRRNGTLLKPRQRARNRGCFRFCFLGNPQAVFSRGLGRVEPHRPGAPTAMMFGAAMIIGLVLAGAILLGLLWAVASYNGLVAARMECTEAFAQVLLRLRQRNALMPALVETARGHMRHERETLEGVNVAVQEAAALGQALSSQTVEESGVHKLQQAEAGVSGAVGRLLALSEAYPELRASPTMVRISEELSFAENQVSVARQAYNAQVHRYNGLRTTLPQTLLSKALGFGDAPFFETATQPAPPQQPQQQRMGPMKA